MKSMWMEVSQNFNNKRIVFNWSFEFWWSMWKYKEVLFCRIIFHGFWRVTIQWWCNSCFIQHNERIITSSSMNSINELSLALFSCLLLLIIIYIKSCNIFLGCKSYRHIAISPKFFVCCWWRFEHWCYYWCLCKLHNKKDKGSKRGT